jgi:SAM-dependent methyltransferase
MFKNHKNTMINISKIANKNNCKRFFSKVFDTFMPDKLKSHFSVEYRKLSTEKVFTKIYKDGVWGKSKDKKQPFFSGSGSHTSFIVGAYVGAVQEFLCSFEKKQNVVDLGCGDFFVGSKIRHLCSRYIACDIVKPVIKFNKKKYENMDVEFQVLDMTKDELPNGDIVFIRQVLQHLSNDQISLVLPKVFSKYKYLVLTEHLPSSEKFIHNVDKKVGPDIRLDFNSGLVLTSAPFDMKVEEERCLCEVEEIGGLVRTILYRLS